MILAFLNLLGVAASCHVFISAEHDHEHGHQTAEAQRQKIDLLDANREPGLLLTDGESSIRRNFLSHCRNGQAQFQNKNYGKNYIGKKFFIFHLNEIKGGFIISLSWPAVAKAMADRRSFDSWPKASRSSFRRLVGLLGIEPSLPRYKNAARSIRGMPALQPETFWSGSRESNPVYLLPKQTYYRYTTPRESFRLDTRYLTGIFTPYRDCEAISGTGATARKRITPPREEGLGEVMFRI